MNIILLLSQLSTNACVNRLLVELNESKALIRDKQAKLDAVVRDVSDRDTAIQQLESMFESTTHRYSENKRRHIKLTHKMVIQATSVMTNASSHVDFLPSLPDSSTERCVQNRTQIVFLSFPLLLYLELVADASPHHGRPKVLVQHSIPGQHHVCGWTLRT